MTRENILRMAREAGFTVRRDGGSDEVMDGDNWHIQTEFVEEFARLVAAAERNKVAQWMIDKGYATGHGDTVDDLLNEFEWQVKEQEREACAKVCDEIANKPSNMVLGVALDCAAAIRARGEK
jgi:hypothetical protein